MRFRHRRFVEKTYAFVRIRSGSIRNLPYDYDLCLSQIPAIFKRHFLLLPARYRTAITNRSKRIIPVFTLDNLENSLSTFPNVTRSNTENRTVRNSDCCSFRMVKSVQYNYKLFSVTSAYVGNRLVQIWFANSEMDVWNRCFTVNTIENPVSLISSWTTF